MGVGLDAERVRASVIFNLDIFGTHPTYNKIINNSNSHND